MKQVILIGGSRHGEKMDFANQDCLVIPDSYVPMIWLGTDSPVSERNARKIVCTHVSIRGNQERNQALADYHQEDRTLYFMPPL